MVSNFLLYDSEKKIAHQKHIEKKYKQSLYTTQTYIRKQVYTIQQFEDIIKKELLEKLEELNKDGKFPGLKSSNRFFFDGDYIKLYSHRYITFISKGYKCCECGLEGSFFAKERTKESKSWHLNLYGIKDGKEVLMTKNHIIPKSLGGKDHVDNYQTMCCRCHSIKR